jgi:zinc transport system substrate-binding protein
VTRAGGLFTESLQQGVSAWLLVSPRVADMIAKETGVKILLLHGAHNISKDDLAGGASFIGLMRKNLEQLRIGLECR